MNEVLIYVGIAVAVAVISIFAGYAHLFKMRLTEVIVLVNRLEQDLEIYRKALTGYREDRVALYERIDDLDREMATARAAMEEWKEAGQIARKSELDFNEGLNNILNFQPGVSKKGDTE